MTERTDTRIAPIHDEDPKIARLLHVDALRGFALFGILAVNIWAFATAYYASGVNDSAYETVSGRSVMFTVSMLFETKFYLIFSFLFGYSFTLQMRSAKRAGTAFRPRMLRRQAGLLAIGVLHAAFLFHGDILTIYAVLSLGLLAWRDWTAERAVKTALGLIIFAGSAWLLLGVANILEGGTTDAAAVHAAAAESTADYRGTVGTVIEQRIRSLPETIIGMLLLQAASALAMFLLGFAAGRRRVFDEVANHTGLRRRLLWWGGPIGLAGSATYAYATVFHPGTGIEILGFGLVTLTGPLLAGAYVCALLALFESAGGRRIVAMLAPTGRAALSNYLSQSLICGVIFTAYGFERIGRLDPPVVAALVPAIFGAQIVASNWWLRHHAYGPAEWILRSITTASWPAWRRAEPDRST